jgi:hypothetical protein
VVFAPGSFISPGPKQREAFKTFVFNSNWLSGERFFEEVKPF